MTSPCKDCNERHTACHADCEKYNEWHKDKVNKEKWLKAKKYDPATIIKYDGINKASKSSNRYSRFYGSKKGWK